MLGSPLGIHVMPFFAFIWGFCSVEKGYRMDIFDRNRVLLVGTMVFSKPYWKSEGPKV